MTRNYYFFPSLNKLSSEWALSVQVTLIQQEKLQVRPLHHFHVLVGGGDLKFELQLPRLLLLLPPNNGVKSNRFSYRAVTAL